VWAMGHAAPKPLLVPDAQGAALLEGDNALSVRGARRGPSPAGCSTMARTQRTAQAPGRPSPRLDPFRPRGAPVRGLRRTTRLQAQVSSAIRHSTSAGIEVSRWHGAPEPWLLGAGSRRAAYERGRRGTRWHSDPAEHRRPVLVGTAGGHQAPCVDIGGDVP